MLQAIINKYLSLDPDVETLLKPLQGKILGITCIDFPKHPIYGSFSNKNLLLTSSIPEHLDLSINSSLNGFIKFALFADKTEIQLSGSIALAESLQKLFANLNIDWEEELSKYSGDIMAHQVMRRCKQLRTYSKDSSNALQEMITEYLQEESGLLPTNCEAQQFMQEVDELRFAVDRLEARIKTHEGN